MFLFLVNFNVKLTLSWIFFKDFGHSCRPAVILNSFLSNTYFCRAAFTSCFFKQNSCIHKICFYRCILQNSCSATIKILGKYLWKSSLFNKVTSRKPATLSETNSFTCIFQWFETQVRNSHFVYHLSVAASEHIVHTFFVKWFRCFHF